ncbi:MAG: Sapep family Mn(2+)-dependent dipeptidase [Thermovirgaceae bacterium]|nr:Sapep family Mn(2+)-dependent dipeptidase [Thermovirgaceae bacterium]
MEHDALLEKYRPQIISSIREMIRIRSVEAPPEKGKPFGEGVHQALTLALETASDLGFRTVNRDGMIGYAEHGAGKEMIAVLGHLDVVPEGKGWTYPPFGAEIHDGRIYGRGATDDKGPTMAALWALKILADEDHRLSKRIRIIFGTNEESGFRGITWYAENEEHPVAGFTPDINEGIVFAEKGGLRIPMEFRTGDPGPIALSGFSSGEAVNIVPDLAEAVFEGEETALEEWAVKLREAVTLLPCGGEVARDGNTLHIRVFGKAAHASLPENGENAIAAMCLLLGKNPPPCPFTSVFGTLSRLLGDSRHGKDLGIAMFDEVSGVLTCNPGLASFSNGILTVTLDIRHPVTIPGETVLKELQARLAPLEVGFSVASRANPLHVPKDSPLILELGEAFFETTGKRPEIIAMGGGTYAKALPNVVAFAPFPNALPELAHQTDEYIEIAELMASIKVIKAAMLRLAK